MAKATSAKATSANDVTIVSSMANDVNYTVYAKGGGDLPVIAAKILVKGGAGLMDKRFETPNATATIVSAAQLEQLKQNVTFQQHLKNGFVTIIQSKNVNAESVAADLNANDGSKPTTEADFGDKAPKTGTDKE